MWPRHCMLCSCRFAHNIVSPGLAWWTLCIGEHHPIFHWGCEGDERIEMESSESKLVEGSFLKINISTFHASQNAVGPAIQVPSARLLARSSQLWMARTLSCFLSVLGRLAQISQVFDLNPGLIRTWWFLKMVRHVLTVGIAAKLLVGVFVLRQAHRYGLPGAHPRCVRGGLDVPLRKASSLGPVSCASVVQAALPKVCQHGRHHSCYQEGSWRPDAEATDASSLAATELWKIEPCCFYFQSF